MGRIYGRYVPTIVVDFDGVIHSYISPWTNAWTIADLPVSGAIDWLTTIAGDVPDAIDAMAHLPKYHIAILSSRSKYPFARWCMKRWLLRNGVPRGYFTDKFITFPRTKPAGILSIDDRATRFTGAFPTAEQIVMFEPWNAIAKAARKAELNRIADLQQQLEHENSLYDLS